MKQLTTKEFKANISVGTLIKLNYDPDNSYGFMYKIGKIICIIEEQPGYYNDLATVRWLAIRTKDETYDPTVYGDMDGFLFRHQLPWIQIMTENDLPELAFLALAIS